MRITIQSVPHEWQRHDQCGDWIFDEQGTLYITVSELGDDRMNFLVALHEAVEAMLCQHLGIPETAVSAFDQAMIESPNEYADDPGHDPKAPYHDPHVFAEIIERAVAQRLGVNWQEYEKKVDAL